jgi:hypothetical protein
VEVEAAARNPCESGKRFPAERERTNCVAWHASPSTTITKGLRGFKAASRKERN